jgi:glycine cleavage system aminomethyltransferase T
MIASIDKTALGPHPMSMAEKPKRPHHIYTLLVEVGRKPGDGLPKDASGAALMCYASGVDEEEAVRETVAILKQADMAVLEVSGYGSLAEREAEGHDIDEEERALMQRALDENSVIVAQSTVFRDGDDREPAQ